MNKNYYDEIWKTLEELYLNKDYLKAQKIIEEELSMPYIPEDFENKLLTMFKNIRSSIEAKEMKLNDEQIEEYLNGDDYKQLMAVNYLDTLNLRNYLEIIEKYLCDESKNLECKCLLISSLINQEINEEIKVNKDELEISFIPKYAEAIEETDGYNSALGFISEIFENNNPTYFNMCKELLIKECFYNLPLAYSEEEGLLIAKSIIVYIYDCFDDKNEKDNFIKLYISDNELKMIKDC